MQVMVSLHPNWNQFIKITSGSNFAVFLTCNIHYKKTLLVSSISKLDCGCSFDLQLLRLNYDDYFIFKVYTRENGEHLFYSIQNLLRKFESI